MMPEAPLPPPPPPPSRRLGIGTTVTITGLVARPELNGVRGRTLKYDAASGRYGIRLPVENGGSLLAVKPSNLDVMPALDVGGADTARELLDLPVDVVESILRRLSARALLRTGQTCVHLHALATAATTDTAWDGLLAHPSLAPYHVPPLHGTGATGFRGAAALRDDWHQNGGDFDREVALG